MKRVQSAVPGYFGSRSAHGDEWHYALVADDGLTAIRLTVFTRDLPDTVPPDIAARWRGNAPPAERVRGADLSLHVAFPTERREMAAYSDLKTWRTRFAEACDLIDRCVRPRSTALGASELFADHGDPSQFQQPIKFWEALARWHADWAAKAHAERVDLLYARCDHCDGLGTVRRESEDQP